MKERIKKVNKSAKKEYVYKTLTSILVRGSFLIIPFFYSYAVQAITDGKLGKAYFLAGMLLTFTVVYYLAIILNDLAYEKIYYKISKGLTKECLEYTERNSIHSLSRIPLGEYNSIMTDDINVIADYYGNVPMTATRIIDFTIIFTYFLKTNLFVGLLSILMSMIVLIFLYFGNRRVNMINEQDKATHSQRLGVLQEYFFGMKEVKGFRLFNSIHKRIERNNDNYLNWHTKYGLFKVIVTNVALAIVEVTRILVLIFGFYLVSKGKISLGVILLVYSYYDRLISNYTGILDFNDRLQNAKVSRNRIYKLEEFSQENKVSDLDQTISRGIVDFKDILYGDIEAPILKN